jgi:hypothetical protein
VEANVAAYQIRKELVCSLDRELQIRSDLPLLYAFATINKKLDILQKLASRISIECLEKGD